MQQSDCQALDAELLQATHQWIDRGLFERSPDFAVGVDAFRHREAALPRHQQIRLVDIDIVLVVAPFVRDLEDVAKSLGGDHTYDCTIFSMMALVASVVP